MATFHPPVILFHAIRHRSPRIFPWSNPSIPFGGRGLESRGGDSGRLRRRGRSHPARWTLVEPWKRALRLVKPGVSSPQRNRIVGGAEIGHVRERGEGEEMGGRVSGRRTENHGNNKQACGWHFWGRTTRTGALPGLKSKIIPDFPVDFSGNSENLNPPLSRKARCPIPLPPPTPTPRIPRRRRIQCSLIPWNNGSRGFFVLPVDRRGDARGAKTPRDSRRSS